MHLITVAQLLASSQRRWRSRPFRRAVVTIKDIQSKSPMSAEKRGQSDGNRNKQSRWIGRDGYENQRCATLTFC